MNSKPRGAGQHVDSPLEDVLRAVTLPGHPAELAGEDEAVAAFRAAAYAPRRPFLSRVLTVRTLVVGAVAVATGVVLAVGGLLPNLWPEPASNPPANPPAVTGSVPEPTMSPPAAPRTVPDDLTGPPATTTTPPAEQPCAAECAGREPEQGKPADRPDPGKGKGKREDNATPPPVEQSVPADGKPSRTKTPGSHAHGAAIAVPPSGAEPPSQGG